MSATTASIRKPRRLKAGEVVGVVAPASPFKRELFERGVGVLREMGYGVKTAPGLFQSDGYLAGTDAHRAQQLQEMFADEDVQAVMCVRGGFGSLRMLPFIDWDLLRRHPKPFIGFSDITAIHQNLYQRLGWITFHGPVVCSLADSEGQTRASFKRALSGQRPLVVRAARRRTLQSGVAQGRLVGGNLTTLCHLVGTSFASSFSGAILFLEDRGEAAYRIDRMLVHMKLAGCFKGLAGLVLGSFKDCAKSTVIEGVVRQIFADRHMPILAGLAVGHGMRNLTLPLGAMVHLDADEGSLRFLECATEERD